MHSTFCLALKSGRSLIPRNNISKVWKSSNNTAQTVISKYSWKKKLSLISGVIIGVPSLVGSVWYLQAEPQQKRRARVTVQGVGRFLRYI